MAILGQLSKVWYVARQALLGIGCSIPLKAHVIDCTAVDGDSMSPTLSRDAKETGRRDWMIWKTWQPAENIQPGDIILFMSPVTPDKTLIKRVIATGGDTVLLDPKRHPCYHIPFNARKPGEHVAAERYESFAGKVFVPYNHVWVEGDNWRLTVDSNEYGAISKSLIVGKALACIWHADMLFSKPWESYKSRTRVKKGKEMLPAAFAT